MKLKTRVEALEQTSGAHLRPWHRVTMEIGQTERDALAAYQSDYGPIGEDNVILREFTSPVLDNAGTIIPQG